VGLSTIDAAYLMTMLIRKAYITSLTYEVSDAEKLQAERALLCFNYALKLLEMASDHLNIMKTPFKDNSEIPSDEVMKARAAIRRFRDKSVENFNEFKIAAFKCVQTMQPFSSDTQTVKVMKSFIASVEDLEDRVNSFVDLFDDLESKSFAKNVVESIEKAQEQCKEVEEITEERIKSHIQSNILAKNWVHHVSDEMQMKIEKQTPLILNLFNEREEQLKQQISGRTTEQA
jgi:hypothetical protein